MIYRYWLRLNFWYLIACSGSVSNSVCFGGYVKSTGTSTTLFHRIFPASTEVIIPSHFAPAYVRKYSYILCRVNAFGQNQRSYGALSSGVIDQAVSRSAFSQSSLSLYTLSLEKESSIWLGTICAVNFFRNSWTGEISPILIISDALLFALFSAALCWGGSVSFDFREGTIISAVHNLIGLRIASIFSIFMSSAFSGSSQRKYDASGYFSIETLPVNRLSPAIVRSVFSHHFPEWIKVTFGYCFILSINADPDPPSPMTTRIQSFWALSSIVKHASLRTRHSTPSL